MSDVEPTRAWDTAADRLGRAAVEDGQPTRWFDELWSAGEHGEIDLPWDRTAAYPPVVDHLEAGPPADGRRAVVVGAGLGADAELLSARGWETVAFDISPAAVRVARERYPASTVGYRVADLVDPAPDLVGRFDLVVEVFTVQAMPPSLRARAGAGLRRLLAPGGEALVVQFVRGDRPPDLGPPWLLDRTEMESFAAGDVALTSLEARPHPTRPGGPDVWVAVLRRQA